MTRSGARGALLILVAMFVVGSAHPASAGTRSIMLTKAERRAIIHAPHPYLRKHCFGPIGFFTAHRTTVESHRVIVAQTDCRGATSGSPFETAAYARSHGSVAQLYRLDSGRPIERPHVTIETLEYAVHHRRVVISYGGYTRHDSLCCPSRTYHRVFHLHRRTFTRGPLVRDT